VAKTKGAAKRATPKAKPRAVKAAAAAPTKAAAVARPPRRAPAPSLPPPPPPPAPPPIRDELAADRDVARLLRYGEKFGARKIDIRWLPNQLPATSGALAVCDPGVPKTWRVLDRPVPPGSFRAMLSIARDGDAQQLAALVIHVGRPPIVRWTIAHPSGHKHPKTPEQAPRHPVTTGWLAIADAGDGTPGPIALPESAGIEPVDIALTDGRHVLAVPCKAGDYAAYWAIDPSDKPVCLVVDLGAFSAKDWRAKPV
jgi:hypothetical protein